MSWIRYHELRESSRRWPWSLPSLPASQIHELKMKVDPFEKIMLSRSVKLSDANSLKTPTWHASCRCFTTDSLPRGSPRQYCSGFSVCGTRRLTQETVDLSWFGPSINDRVIALRPVGVSLYVGLIVCCRIVEVVLPSLGTLPSII